MNMRVEGDEITEGLHVQDERGLTARVHDFEAGPQQSGNQPAKLTEIAAVEAKEWPDELGQRKHVLTMRYRGEQVPFQPLTVGERALLMTARAEVAGLAGVGQQIIVAAPIAVDARKATVEVAAGHESFEHLALDGSVDEPGRIEFRAVSANTLIQRARPRIARLVDAAGWWLRVRAHGNRARAALLP
jgi:hypothetical protein